MRQATWHRTISSAMLLENVQDLNNRRVGDGCPLPVVFGIVLVHRTVDGAVKGDSIIHLPLLPLVVEPLAERHGCRQRGRMASRRWQARVRCRI